MGDQKTRLKGRGRLKAQKSKFLMIFLALGFAVVTHAHQKRPFWMKSSYVEFCNWYKKQVMASLKKTAQDKNTKLYNKNEMDFFDSCNLESMKDKYQDRIYDIGYLEGDINGDKKADTVAVIYQSGIFDPDFFPDPKYHITEESDRRTYYILFYISGRTPFFESFSASYDYELYFVDIFPKEPRFLILRASSGHGTAVKSDMLYIQQYLSNSFITIFKKDVFGFLSAGSATFTKDVHFEDIDKDGIKEAIFDLKIDNPDNETVDEDIVNSLGPKREIFKYNAKIRKFILLDQSVNSSVSAR